MQDPVSDLALTFHNIIPCSAPSDWSLVVSAAARSSPPVAACRQSGRCMTLSQGFLMPPCVPPGLRGVPSTRTNRGGPSGCSSWARPRECPPHTQVCLTNSCLCVLCDPHGAGVCWYCSLFVWRAEHCCWSVLWTLWEKGICSESNSSFTKAELCPSSNKW